MERITLSDFTRGMVQRISPDDYQPGEWGYLEGFVPDDDRSIRSQWPIQSIGGESREWVGTNVAFETNGSGKLVPVFSTGSANTSDVISIFPIRAASGVFMVAIKADGTLWWAKMPAGTDDYATANAVVWSQLVVAKNRGFSIYADHLQQPYITVESNPDYRFICELPLEVYKYIKEPQPPKIVGGYITVNGSNGGYTGTNATKVDGAEPVEGVNPAANAWFLDFTKDSLPDANTLNDETGALDVTELSKFARSTVSGVLIHSRRFYEDGRLTRTKDYQTRKTVTNKASSGTARTLTVGSGHGFLANDFITVDIGDSNYDGFRVITSVTSTQVSYTATGSVTENVAVANANAVVYKYHRNQTAVVAYVDPYTDTVSVVTFPNFRRWPMYATDNDQTKSFSGEYRPMPSWAVMTTGEQKKFPFIDKYPYNPTTKTAIDSPDIDDVTAPNYGVRSAFPKYNASNHPYTYLDKNKTMLPGRGIVPRCFTGTMLGNLLILGDIEWKEDSSNTFLTDKRLVPTKNTVAASSGNSNFGLRDDNTEPHRGFLYYSQDDIDVFDPRSVLRVSGTDTRITGMHTLNNKIIAITSSGGSSDGVFTLSGNFSSLHPYTPGELANPLAVRKELLLGGVGTADADDSYNHGNPQTALWPELGRVAFIDKSGYVYTTDGEGAAILDNRYPILGTPNESTVNDHVAAVGKHLFVYKNGYLLVYSTASGKGAWYIIKRPYPMWEVAPDYEDMNIEQYNVIRSMRGIGNELYFIVHSYWIECDENYVPLVGAEPVLGASRVMRYALAGPDDERGRQDDELLDNLTIETPTIGIANQSKRVYWRMAGINFFTDTGCDLVGVGTTSTYPASDNTDGLHSTYQIGVFESPEPNLDMSFQPVLSTPIDTFPADGYYNYEFSTGVGPQRIISVRFVFRGDVRIEGVNIFHTGRYDLQGESEPTP